MLNASNTFNNFIYGDKHIIKALFVLKNKRFNLNHFTNIINFIRCTNFVNTVNTVSKVHKLTLIIVSNLHYFINLTWFFKKQTCFLSNLK